MRGVYRQGRSGAGWVPREGEREGGGKEGKERTPGSKLNPCALSSLTGLRVIMVSDATAAHNPEDQLAAEQVVEEGGREGGT